MQIAIDIFHNSLSLLFVIFAIIVLWRSVQGWKRKLEWVKRDYHYAITLVVIMYLQMFLGLYLFFAARYLNTAETVVKPTELRFWPVEHFFTMIFALLVAQLGLVIAVNTKKHVDKHRVIFIYYTISLVFTFFSLAMILRV